jgi:hypothetical protein
MRTAYNTGGVGVHGVQHPEPVADSMFSQGSVKVSPTGNMVAVVNVCSVLLIIALLMLIDDDVI